MKPKPKVKLVVPEIEHSTERKKAKKQRRAEKRREEGFSVHAVPPSLTPHPRSSMFLKVELPWNVLIPPENLDVKGLMLQRAIIIRLMDEFARRKATEDHGYFVAPTTVNSIGEGKVRQETGGVLFPVVFNCITFKPFKGEILKGVVNKVLKVGVFLTCGPIKTIYIPTQTMPDYEYVQGENPVFMNDNLSKIEKGVELRFIVIGAKWMEIEREFKLVGSLAGDFLGPV